MQDELGRKGGLPWTAPIRLHLVCACGGMLRGRVRPFDAARRVYALFVSLHREPGCTLGVEAPVERERSS